MGIVSEQEFIARVRKMDRFSFTAGERDDVSRLDTHDVRYVEDGRFCANLHVHTENSDGTMTVEEVLKNARILSDKNPNFLVAITDHDTVEGDKEAVELIKEYEDVNLCCGLEISTYAISFPNQPKPIQVHLLVYGVNPFDERLNKFLADKMSKKLALAKETVRKLNEALPKYNFTLEEAAKCHNMVLKGQDEVAHPLKKYTSGKILLNYYLPNADFSYEEPIYKFKYLFKGKEPYHLTYKKALEMFINSELPEIPDFIEKEIKIAREIYMKAHPAIGHMPEQFSDFEDTVKFVASLDSGVMSIAHPARSKAYCPEFYDYLFANFKRAGGEKAMFYEGYYQSYEGEYFQKWQRTIDDTASKYDLLKTGGLDSHGKNLVYRTRRKDLVC